MYSLGRQQHRAGACRREDVLDRDRAEAACDRRRRRRSARGGRAAARAATGRRRAAGGRRARAAGRTARPAQPARAAAGVVDGDRDDVDVVGQPASRASRRRVEERPRSRSSVSRARRHRARATRGSPRDRVREALDVGGHRGERGAHVLLDPRRPRPRRWRRTATSSIAAPIRSDEERRGAAAGDDARDADAALARQRGAPNRRLDHLRPAGYTTSVIVGLWLAGDRAHSGAEGRLEARRADRRRQLAARHRPVRRRVHPQAAARRADRRRRLPRRAAARHQPRPIC